MTNLSSIFVGEQLERFMNWNFQYLIPLRQYIEKAPYTFPEKPLYYTSDPV